MKCEEKIPFLVTNITSKLQSKYSKLEVQNFWPNIKKENWSNKITRKRLLVLLTRGHHESPVSNTFTIATVNYFLTRQTQMVPKSDSKHAGHYYFRQQYFTPLRLSRLGNFLTNFCGGGRLEVMTVAEQQSKPNSIRESQYRSDYNCSMVGILTLCKMLIMMYQAPKGYGVKEFPCILFSRCYPTYIISIWSLRYFNTSFEQLGPVWQAVRCVVYNVMVIQTNSTGCSPYEKKAVMTIYYTLP